jgi:hypothetical protein
MEHIKKATSKEEVVRIATEMLTATDYAVLPDVSVLLDNLDEIKSYRAEIRELIISPSDSYTFNKVPKAVWISSLPDTVELSPNADDVVSNEAET